MPQANVQFLLDIVIHTQVFPVLVWVVLEVIAIVDWELDQRTVLVVVLLLSPQQRHPMLEVYLPRETQSKLYQPQDICNLVSSSFLYIW